MMALCRILLSCSPLLALERKIALLFVLGHCPYFTCSLVREACHRAGFHFCDSGIALLHSARLRRFPKRVSNTAARLHCRPLLTGAAPARYAAALQIQKGEST